MTKVKIEELKEKIKKDLEKIEKLEQQRNSEITKLISRVNLNNIEDELIIGGLLYIKEQLSENDNINNEHNNNNKENESSIKLKEEWLAAGKKFLKRKTKSMS